MGIQIKGSNDTISAADGSMVLEGSALVFDNENITGISTMGTGHITGTATIDDDLKVGISTLFADNSTGRIGIGTDIPDSNLHIWSHSNDTRIEIDSQGFKRNNYIGVTGADNLEIAADEDNLGGDSSIRFRIDAGEKVRIDSSGRLIIGHTATDDRDGYNSALQVSGTGGDDASACIGRWSANTSAPGLAFSKSRNGTIGSHTVVAADDVLGMVQFQGDDGTNYHVGADIRATVVTGVGNDDMPADLIFSTNAGSTGTTERLRITSGGQLNLAGNMQFTAANPELEFNNGGPRFRVPSANTLTVYTGGGLGATSNERLRIDSNGYVGIKLTDPHLYYAKDLVVQAIAQGGITIKSPNTTDTNYLMFADGTSGNERYKGYIGYSHNTGTDGGEHMQFAASGGLGLMRFYTDGLALSGETATANRISDYEEGTWTPECRIETRAASDSPTDAVDGCYTKVGRLVTCHGRFTLNGTPSERSTSRAIELRGFPFDHNHDWDKVSGDIRVTGHDIASTYGQDIYFVMRMISGQQYARIEIIEQSYNGTRNASVVMQDNMNVQFTFTFVTV